MPRSHRETRLGNLLLEKGIITFDQLTEALDVQRRRTRGYVDGIHPQCQLGEVLVTLGYVKPGEISHFLKKQSFLRKVAMTFAIAAPLLSISAPSLALKQPTMDTPQSVAALTQGGSTHGGQRRPGKILNFGLDDASHKSSRPVAEEAGTITVSDSQTANGYGVIRLDWVVPTMRDDGVELNMQDIGGYCLSYKREGESRVSSLFINNPKRNHCEIVGLAPGEYKFYLAAFDTQGEFGHYSPAVKIRI